MLKLVEMGEWKSGEWQQQTRGKQSLFLTSTPHNQTPDDTYHQLGSGDEPMGMNHVGGLLVVHIIKSVSGIPADDQKRLYSKKL